MRDDVATSDVNRSETNSAERWLNGQIAGSEFGRRSGPQGGAQDAPSQSVVEH